MENMQTEDRSMPVEATPGPIEKPEALNLDEVQSKAIGWNKSWKVYYDSKKPQWEHNYKLFRQFDQGLVENITTRVYEVWANIQTEIPHIVNSIFTKSEVVKPFPKFRDEANKTLKIKNYINRMILIANQGRKLATDAIQDFLVFGTVVGKTFWDNEESAEFDISTQEWVPKYEGKPASYNVDIFDFALDPAFRGHDVQKALWCRERMYFTKEQLKEKMLAGEIIDLDENQLLPGGTPVESGEQVRDRLEGVPVAKKSNKAYVDEFYCTLYWDEDGEQKSGKFYFWLLNDSKIIKFKRNVFNKKPFVVARCYRLTHEFFGLGDVDVMSALAEQINVVHSQAGLLAKKTGQKLTLYTKAAGIDQQTLKRKEDGLLMVKDLNAIRTENTTAGADLGTMINYKGSVKGDLSNAVGINDLLRGEDPGDVTATQISIMNSNSSARLSLKLQNFQDEYVVPLAAHFYWLSKQFIDTYSLIVDNQLIELTQEDFAGEYDWVAQGTVAMANRNLRIQQMTELAVQLTNASMAAMNSGGSIKFPKFDLGKFYENEVLSIYEIPNASQYFEEPAPAQLPQETALSPEEQAFIDAQAMVNQGTGEPIASVEPISENTLETGNLGNMEGSAVTID